MTTTITTEQIKQASTQYRNLELIQNQAIYTTKIKVKKGRKTKALHWEYLGLPPEQVEALNKYGSTPGSLRLVEIVENECKQGKNSQPRLNKLIHQLKNEYLIYFPPHYFFAESQIEEITDILNRIFAEEERIRNKIEEVYEEEYSKQAEKIREQIKYNPLLNSGEIDQIINKYLAYYSTKQELLNGFGIEIEHLEKIPSLIEQGKTNLELQEYEQKQKELNSISDLQNQYISNIQKKLNQATDQVVQEALDIVSESVQKIEGIKAEGKNLTNHCKHNLKKAVDRIHRLSNFNSSLAEMAESFSEYTEKEIELRGNPLSDELKQIKQKLKLDLEQASSHTHQGHKKIAQWL